MLLKILRFIRGYVEFTARGRFPERFINLTSRYGIFVWNTLPVEGGLSGAMSVGDYKRIRSTASRAKVVLKIKRKHGLPFHIRKYRDRGGLFVGAVLGLALTIFLSNFVWTFSVTGNKTVTEKEILTVLSEQGMGAGAYKKGVDVDRISRNTLRSIDRLSWMSINLNGCKASVEVKEKTDKPELTDDSKPCNIKAGKDGVITEIRATEGKAEVSSGSGVAEGDLIVSGIVPTSIGAVRYVRAKAEVYADVSSEKKIFIPEKGHYFSLTENKVERNRLHFLIFEMPVSLSFSSYNQSVRKYSDSNFVQNGEILPIGIKTETTQELIEKEITADKKIAELQAQTELMLYEVFERGESTLVSRKTSLKKQSEGYLCEAKYVFNENIARSVDFSVTEQG